MGGGMNTRQQAAPCVLLVEDDVALSKAISRRVGRYLDVIVEHDVDGALARMAREEAFCGFVFDMYFDDRYEGLRLLDARSRSYPGVPAVVHTAYLEEEIAVAAAECGAILLPKSRSIAFFERFALGCLVRARSESECLGAAIEDAVAAYRLTPMEAEALCEACGVRLDPDVSARAREARNRRALDKTGSGRMEILRGDVLLAALTREWAKKTT